MDGQPAFRRDPRLKLSDQVAIELERQILGGAYKPGHRLPTEPELYEWLGVSRTVLRDALRTLASFGLITVRQGVASELRGARARLVIEERRHLELGILRGDFLGRASNQIQPDSTLPVIVDGKIPGLLHIFPYDAQR